MNSDGFLADASSGPQMHRARYRDLRDLCPHCWQRPHLPGGDRCQECALRAEWLRRVAQADQNEAGEHHLAAVSAWRNGAWRR